MPVVKGDSRSMCKCLRCGHVWITDSGITIPKKCAKCTSRYWNKPRQRAVRRTPEAMSFVERAKRTGPLFSALKTLSAIDAESLAKDIPEWQKQHVEPFVDTALANLGRFKELWNGRAK